MLSHNLCCLRVACRWGPVSGKASSAKRSATTTRSMSWLVSLLLEGRGRSRNEVDAMQKARAQSGVRKRWILGECSPANSPPRSLPTQKPCSVFPSSCRYHPLQTMAYPQSAQPLQSGPHSNDTCDTQKVDAVLGKRREYLAREAHGRVV